MPGFLIRWVINAVALLLISQVIRGIEVAGIVAPDGKELPPRKGRLSSILLQERGKWWIAASRLMIPAPLPGKPS